MRLKLKIIPVVMAENLAIFLESRCSIMLLVTGLTIFQERRWKARSKV